MTGSVLRRAFGDSMIPEATRDLYASERTNCSPAERRESGSISVDWNRSGVPVAFPV